MYFSPCILPRSCSHASRASLIPSTNAFSCSSCTWASSLSCLKISISCVSSVVTSLPTLASSLSLLASSLSYCTTAKKSCKHYTSALTEYLSTTDPSSTIHCTFCNLSTTLYSFSKSTCKSSLSAQVACTCCLNASTHVCRTTIHSTLSLASHGWNTTNTLSHASSISRASFSPLPPSLQPPPPQPFIFFGSPTHPCQRVVVHPISHHWTYT